MRWLLLLMCLLTAAVDAEEPDFYLAFSDCSLVIGGLSNGKLSVGSGEPPVFGCTRQTQKMICAVAYPNGKQADSGITDSYTVLLDSPPLMYFASGNGAAFFAINTQTRFAVMTARISDVSYAGEKVCVGSFATQSELYLLQQQSRAQ